MPHPARSERPRRARPHALARRRRQPGREGKNPNITPAKTGIGSWSQAEITEYLATGFTPDYDSVGGAMVEVQANMAKLTDADRAAIAAYLKAVPGVEPVG